MQQVGIADLVARFPRLFHGEHPAVMSHLEPGWSQIVWDLCVEIDGLLDDDAAPQFRVMQIKEKFAGLRFYWRMDNGDDIALRIEAAVTSAEARAAAACQTCGDPGRLRNDGGWLCTLCDEHDDEWKRRREQS